MKEIDISREEFNNCMQSALHDTIQVVDKLKNNGNVQTYTSVGYYRGNGTEYQVQLVFTPCEPLWCNTDEVKTVSVDSIGVTNRKVSSIGLKKPK